MEWVSSPHYRELGCLCPRRRFGTAAAAPRQRRRAAPPTKEFIEAPLVWAAFWFVRQTYAFVHALYKCPAQGKKSAGV